MCDVNYGMRWNNCNFGYYMWNRGGYFTSWNKLLGTFSGHGDINSANLQTLQFGF